MWRSSVRDETAVGNVMNHVLHYIVKHISHQTDFNVFIVWFLYTICSYIGRLLPTYTAQNKILLADDWNGRFSNYFVITSASFDANSNPTADGRSASWAWTKYFIHSVRLKVTRRQTQAWPNDRLNSPVSRLLLGCVKTFAYGPVLKPRGWRSEGKKSTRKEKFTGIS